MDQGEIEPLLVGIDTGARTVGLGRSKFYELVRSGDIEVVHIGRAVRVPTSELRRYVERIRAEQSDLAPA